jgi:hypothetical protein
MTLLTSHLCSLQILDQDLIPWDQDSDLMHPEGKCVTQFACSSKILYTAHILFLVSIGVL